MEELIEQLQYLGIPRREAEVYIALLQKKEFTAPEIAEITSVSRTKSYEILQNLVKKNLCNQSYLNGAKVFSSVDPKIVIENIKSDYEKKKNIANDLKRNLSQLYKVIENIGTLDYIEVLNDPRQIRERWLSIQGNTKKELLIFTKPPYTSPLEANLKAEAKVLKKKIIDKSLYEYNGINSSSEINNFIKKIESYQKIGEESRIVKSLPMKLAISDETITMLALTDRVSMKPSITTMIIDHPNFAIAQKKVFESYWVNAITINEFKNNLNKYIKTTS
jgi:HTH-type transcriptional regulator, sugar sensing transcriptional regulator